MKNPVRTRMSGRGKRLKLVVEGSTIVAGTSKVFVVPESPFGQWIKARDEQLFGRTLRPLHRSMPQYLLEYDEWGQAGHAYMFETYKQ